jgi:hypothetical protein
MKYAAQCRLNGEQICLSNLPVLNPMPTVVEQWGDNVEHQHLMDEKPIG